MQALYSWIGRSWYNSDINDLHWSMLIINISRIDICFRMSEYYHYQPLTGWILTNQQFLGTLHSDVIWALRSGVALRLSPYDVTQPAPWQPPYGVRRVVQKRSQLCNIYNQIWQIEQFYMGSQWHDVPPLAYIYSAFSFPLLNSVGLGRYWV